MVEGAAAWGTTPVRPYDPRGPVGMMQSDGFQAPVGAVLLDDQKEVLLLACLTGPRATVAALFAQLLQGKMVLFSSTAATTTEWRKVMPAETWLRASGRYRQIAVPLVCTRGVVAVLLSHSLDLQQACSRTPRFPPQALSPQTAEEPSSEPLAPVLGDGILLGNVGESRPALSTFLVFLRATRAILPSGERLAQWAEVLWEAGVQEGLIEPLPAAGIRGWKVVGQAARWNDCIIASYAAQLHWPH
ncbi:hypothetical protein [Thermogemmatispora sp.]|uniref:hypothetical protein n=1 Tax=Thermogemmatispora sp. TaxID=1968838 RepID=UPI0035E41940